MSWLIVDAMRALHAEGDLRPTAPRVAERAVVSLRTVWQQFADMETLLVEANRRDDEIMRSLMEQIDPDLPLAARVALFTGQRARILEQMSFSWRAARIGEPFSEELKRSKARTLAVAKADLGAVFAPGTGGAARGEAPAAARRPARGQHLVVLGVVAHRAQPQPGTG
jgi:TetR/AcrR family transcriptional regulator of autoinduction and epiphytic fitness